MQQKVTGVCDIHEIYSEIDVRFIKFNMYTLIINYQIAFMLFRTYLFIYLSSIYIFTGLFFKFIILTIIQLSEHDEYTNNYNYVFPFFESRRIVLV